MKSIFQLLLAGSLVINSTHAQAQGSTAAEKNVPVANTVSPPAGAAPAPAGNGMGNGNASGQGRGNLDANGRPIYRLTPSAPIAGCPFSPSAPDFQMISNLSIAVETLESNDSCRGGEARSTNNFASQVAALRSIQEISSCNLVQSAERDYQFVTSGLEGEALGYVPTAYQQCRRGQNAPLDTNCVEQIHTQQVGNLRRQCRDSQREDMDRLAARSLDEAAILMTSSVSRLISNPACTSEDALPQLADTAINALPLIATSIPGFGLPIAMGAQVVSSLLTRMFSSRSTFDKISDRLQAVGIRCLHFQAMATLLNCDGDSTNQSALLEVERGMVSGLSRLSDELKRVAAEGESPRKLNNGVILRILNEPINLPDGSQSTLRAILTQIQQQPAPDPQSTAAVQRARIDQLLALNASSDIPSPGVDDFSEGVLDFLNDRYPSSIGNIASAWTDVRTGPRLAPPAPRQENLVNDTLGRFTQEIFDRERNGQFSFQALATLERNARNATGNDIEFRKNSLRERFNTCAYNSFLLLADRDGLDDKLKDNNQGSILSAIDASKMADFQRLCGEYSCVINIPSSFRGPDDYKAWQCRIFKNQQSVARALDTKITAWASNGANGRVCDPGSSGEGAADGAPAGSSDGVR